MTSRRTIVKGGALLAGAFAAAPDALAAALHKDLTPDGVALVDPRFAASSLWGEAMRGRKATPVLLDRDIAEVWLKDLPDILRTRGEISGLTLYSDQMISEVFGRQHGFAPYGETETVLAPSAHKSDGQVELRLWRLRRTDEKGREV